MPLATCQLLLGFPLQFWFCSAFYLCVSAPAYQSARCPPVSSWSSECSRGPWLKSSGWSKKSWFSVYPGLALWEGAVTWKLLKCQQWNQKSTVSVINEEHSVFFRNNHDCSCPSGQSFTHIRNHPYKESPYMAETNWTQWWRRGLMKILELMYGIPFFSLLSCPLALYFLQVP